MPATTPSELSRLGFALLDLRPFLPDRWADAVRTAAVTHGQHVVAHGRGPGSLEPEETAGLDYHVLDRSSCIEHLSFLVALQEDPRLVSLVREAVGEEVEPLRDNSGLNVNYLRGRGGRYELHTDSIPYTLLLFASDHAPNEGGQLLLAPPERQQTLLQPIAGTGAVFDGSVIPHAVTPLERADAERLSIPMVFAPERAMRDRPIGLDTYLYGSSQ